MDVADADRLELLGTLLGVFVVLTGLGGLAGMPWQTNPDLAAVALQLLGLVLTIGVGIALIYVVRME